MNRVLPVQMQISTTVFQVFGGTMCFIYLQKDAQYQFYKETTFYINAKVLVWSNRVGVIPLPA